MRHERFSICTRRVALGAVLGLSATLVLPSAHAGDFDGVTLRVATWGGSWKKNFEDKIVPKMEALGGEIEFVTGSPQANLAKLIAARGRAPFDVMEILDAQEDDFRQGEFLQKLDLSKIPNTADLEDFQYNDQWVATWTTQEIICYNTEKFAELGIPVPATYADLEHPALEGRVMIPDITSGGGLANFGGLVHAAGGDETNVQPGLDLINKLKIRKFWSRGGQTVTEYQSGDIYASISHAGWCQRAAMAGAPVATVQPLINDAHTGVHKYGWMGIMKSTTDAKTIEAAHWFMNEYLDGEYQYYFAKQSGVAPVNRKGLALMAEDELVSKFMTTDLDALGRFLRIDYGKVDISQWMDQWNRAIAQ